MDEKEVQERLFHLQIVYDYPYEPNTAVLRRKSRAEDGLTYAVKGKTHVNDYTPVNEWICANIARGIGIPTPDFKMLQDWGGSFLFGSRWETGLKPHADFFNQIEDTSVYSAILAFDLLVLNIDRHIQNYLVQEVDSNHKLLAFDHSHTLLYHNPFPKETDILFFPSQQSRAVLYILANLNIKIDEDKIKTVLSKFSSLEVAFFDRIISQCSHWISDAASINLLINWLKLRHNCINSIYEQLGRYNYEPLSILSGLSGA